MQSDSGRMEILTETEVLDATPMETPKTISEGMYFKIKHTYFKITEINTEGIVAQGVSRREYFDNRGTVSI